MHVSSLIFVTRACSKEHSPDPIHHPHLSVTFHSAFQVRMSHGIPDSVQSRWKHLWGQSRPSSYSSSLHIVAALICAMPGRASCQPMTRRRCAGLNLSFETTLSSGRYIPGAGGIDTCSRVSRSHICTHLYTSVCRWMGERLVREVIQQFPQFHQVPHVSRGRSTEGQY
jgi:hypothetical protein